LVLNEKGKENVWSTSPFCSTPWHESERWHGIVLSWAECEWNEMQRREKKSMSNFVLFQKILTIGKEGLRKSLICTAKGKFFFLKKVVKCWKDVSENASTKIIVYSFWIKKWLM